MENTVTEPQNFSEIASSAVIEESTEKKSMCSGYVIALDGKREQYWLVSTAGKF